MRYATIFLIICLIGCAKANVKNLSDISTQREIDGKEVTPAMDMQDEVTLLEATPQQSHEYALQKDYYEGEDCYSFSYESGWLDVSDQLGKIASFRAPVDIKAFISRYGFELIEPAPQNPLLSMKEVQLVKRGIAVWIVDDVERSSSTWISKIEITDPQYIVANIASIGLTKEQFNTATGITVAGPRVVLFYDGMKILPAIYGYTISGTDFDMLETFVEIQFTENTISKITLFTREGFFYP